MMNVNWFKNPDHIVYLDAEKHLRELGKRLGIDDLEEAALAFRVAPTPEGKILPGKRRTSVKLFIPDLVFDEHLDMGESVWLYMGEMNECYALFWPWEQTNPKQAE